MNRPLTSRQQAVYDFIRDKILNRGYGPTVREIGEHLDIRSPNGVMCHLRALERKEMIRRLANKSRAIELTESISRQETVGLPLVGRATASACTINMDSALEIGFSKLLRRADRYLLQVFGDSLRDQHLINGDFLVVEKRDEAHAGDLVVARAEDGQLMLKRWQIERDEASVQSTNQSQGTLSSRLTVVGVVNGIVREFQ